MYQKTWTYQHLVKNWYYLLHVIVAGGQRCQTVHAIDIRDINLSTDRCVIPLYEKLKQTRPGNHLKPLGFKPFHAEPKLCVIQNLIAYLNKTKQKRKDTQLFISYIKPYRAVTKDTVARWSKSIMKEAGIDIEKYCTHSSRSAASSYVKSKGISLKHIALSAGWSNEKTFGLHYDKDIEEFNIGQSILT